ncbi:MAG: cysteine-rich CWC family protein [Candidatus Puniceispirillaceae bacterium]
MEKLICERCGTSFKCGSKRNEAGEITQMCWCAHLPNFQDGFDLAGSCLCPDCLTNGKAKAVTRQKKAKTKARQTARQSLATSGG